MNDTNYATHIRRKRVIDFDCPVCNAAPGGRCHSTHETRFGEPLRRPHEERAEQRRISIDRARSRGLGLGFGG